MWVQELHFLLLSLYRGPFGGPVVKVGAEIALFAKRGKYQGALGPFLSERGPSGPFISRIKRDIYISVTAEPPHTGMSLY